MKTILISFVISLALGAGLAYAWDNGGVNEPGNCPFYNVHCHD